MGTAWHRSENTADGALAVIGSGTALDVAGWKDIIVKRIFTVGAALVALLVIGTPIASAAVIELPINTVVTAAPGSTTLLLTGDTPSDLVGENCLVTATATNQSSIHHGNDLIVASGNDSITLKDVERSGHVVTEASDHLSLGATITVSLYMGQDGVFSGGFTVNLECPPPTTTTTAQTTTTTEPPTTTTSPSTTPPAIVIEKTAVSEYYGEDGIGHFTITVTNPGPVDLTDVFVTDDVAVAMDPNSDCPNPEIPDLAVGESSSYECAVANLDGVSPFTNDATATGTGPDGTKVSDTDDATVLPQVLSTTITTTPPTTAPPGTVPPTLPVTGVPVEQVRGVSFASLGFLMAGIALLGVAALIGHQRVLQTTGYDEIWLELKRKPQERTHYIRLRPKDG